MSTAARLLKLARNAPPADAASPVDTELLRRYAADRDEAGFAELVRRHGPLVLRVCRHVLGEAAADDAFQATFLLLARSARRLTKPGSLAGWLHAAAVKIAHNTRRGEDRRKRREAARRIEPSSADEMTWREVREVLDVEIAELTESDRVAVVLCYVLELNYEEAARQAGCPVGTLRNRLDRGKERLRKRLARYGLPLAAPALVVGSPSPVSAALVDAAMRSAFATGALPPALAALLPSRRLHTLLLAPAVVAVVAVGAVLAVYPAGTPKDEPPHTAKQAVTTLQPLTDQLGDPLPLGAVARLGTRRLFGPSESQWAAYSPDGTKLAVYSHGLVTVCDATTGKPLVERRWYGVEDIAIGWRADGTGVAVVALPDHTHFVSAFSEPDEKLPNPPEPNPVPKNPGADGIEIFALSSDAKYLATVSDDKAKQFTIDIRPATVGNRIRDIPPTRTLGPFAGPCEGVRYTARGILFLTGDWNVDGSFAVSRVDAEKNAVVQTFCIPTPAYCAWGKMLSISHDGKLAAIPRRPIPAKPGQYTTNDHDGTIRVWALEAGKEVRSLPFARAGYGTGHAFTPDGKKLIAAGDNPYFHIWDVASGKELARAPLTTALYPHNEAPAIAVSPDGKQFATVRRDGRIDIWDTVTAKPVLPYETHRDAVTAVVVSPDGRLAASQADDDAIRVWELATGKPLQSIPAPRVEPNVRAANARRLAFTPDGLGLLFVSGERLALVEPLTGKPLVLPGGIRDFKGKVAEFAADGKTLVTYANDTVTLWDWPAGNARLKITVPLAPPLAGEKRTMPVQSDIVRIDYAVSLSPDGRFLFTNSIREYAHNPRLGGYQNANDVWDARTGKLLHRLGKPETWYPPAAFSPDSRVLYLGGHSLDWPKRGRKQVDALTAWDATTGKFLRHFVESDRPIRSRPHGDFGRRVPALAVSPDGRLLAVSEDVMTFDGVWIYETVSGRPLKHFMGHARAVTDLAFTPYGRRLVSVSEDQTGLVWDVTLPALVAIPTAKPTQKELAEAWGRLAAVTPELGYRGIAALVADPENAVALLKEKLRPPAIPTDEELDRVTARLGAEEFADREAASAELERFGPNAIAGAQARLAKAESPEVRNRLNRFLTRFGGPDPSPYELRCVRGVAALEAIGTREAKQLLAELANGKAEDVLTAHATSALKRWRSDR